MHALYLNILYYKAVFLNSFYFKAINEVQLLLFLPQNVPSHRP